MASMENKTLILDELAIRRAIARITHEIIERNHGVENVCLLGIKRRGVPLAEMLAENILKFENISVPVGTLDITIHRDDLSEQDKADKAGECSFPCDITDKDVVIVDDVLYTGRTTRAAIEAVFSSGRPRSLQLAVLIDRGHRELPIRADYVGKNVPTSRSEIIDAHIDSIDGETAVYICDGISRKE